MATAEEKAAAKAAAEEKAAADKLALDALAAEVGNAQSASASASVAPLRKADTLTGATVAALAAWLAEDVAARTAQLAVSRDTALAEDARKTGTALAAAYTRRINQIGKEVTRRQSV
jgi:hypothetical protein